MKPKNDHVRNALTKNISLQSEPESKLKKSMFCAFRITFEQNYD